MSDTPLDTYTMGDYDMPTDRTDAPPMEALAECHDLWATGAWDDRNAVYDLAEVMGHIERLLNINTDKKD